MVYGGTTTPKQGTALYNLAFDPSPTTANSWTLIATPITGTQQAGDGVICLNDQGQKFWAKAAATCSLSATSDWSGR
jgi:type IV pilus assembly protein PilE